MCSHTRCIRAPVRSHEVTSTGNTGTGLSKPRIRLWDFFFKGTFFLKLVILHFFFAAHKTAGGAESSKMPIKFSHAPAQKAGRAFFAASKLRTRT